MRNQQIHLVAAQNLGVGYRRHEPGHPIPAPVVELLGRTPRDRAEPATGILIKLVFDPRLIQVRCPLTGRRVYPVPDTRDERPQHGFTRIDVHRRDLAVLVVENLSFARGEYGRLGSQRIHNMPHQRLDIGAAPGDLIAKLPDQVSFRI